MVMRGSSFKISKMVLVWFIGFICGVVPSPAQDGAHAFPEAPIVDPAYNAQMVAILHQMDVFNGDSAMALIGSLLGKVEQDDIEKNYFLLSYRAEVLYYEGLFNEAMRDLGRAEQMAFQLNDSLKIANVYNMKGLLHENIQNGDLAIPYLKKALQWFPVRSRSPWPLSDLHHIHGNLGSYLTLSAQKDSAEYHLRRSLELATAAGRPRAIAVANWSLGILDLRLNKNDSAVMHFTKAFDGAVAALDHDVALDAVVGKAKALIALQQTGEAERTLTAAREHLELHLNAIGAATRRNFARDASRAYEDMGDTKNALSQSHTWRNLDSTIAARNAEQALATQAQLLRTDSELLLERTERERVAEVLRIERYRRRMWLIGGILVLAALTMTYFVNASRQRNKRKLAESETLRVQQAGLIQELRLREEIGRDLHDDIGVGLSGIKLRSEMALRVEQDPGKRELLSGLASTAGELIGSMRQIIRAMATDQASVEDLVVYTTNYTRIYCEQQGLTPEIITSAEWPSIELTSEQRRNIFLVLKEALHNVVKHANARHLRLKINWDQGLRVELEDDGIGLPSHLEESVGNGLRNMRKRIEVLGGSLTLGSGIGSSKDQPGTGIVVHIPLKGGGGNESSIARVRTSGEFRPR